MGTVEPFVSHCAATAIAIHQLYLVRQDLLSHQIFRGKTGMQILAKHINIRKLFIVNIKKEIVKIISWVASCKMQEPSLKSKPSVLKIVMGR